jgi:hypothetical protein
MAFKSLLKNDAEAAKVIEQRMKKLVKLQVRICAEVLGSSVDHCIHGAFQRLCAVCWWHILWQQLLISLRGLCSWWNGGGSGLTQGSTSKATCIGAGCIAIK